MINLKHNYSHEENVHFQKDITLYNIRYVQLCDRKEQKKKKKSQFEKSHVYQQDRTLCEESFKVFS